MAKFYSNTDQTDNCLLLCQIEEEAHVNLYQVNVSIFDMKQIVDAYDVVSKQNLWKHPLWIIDENFQQLFGYLREYVQVYTKLWN